MIWMFSSSALGKLAAAAGGMALLSGPLNSPDTWVYGKDHHSDIPAHAKRLSVLTNVDQLQSVKSGLVVADLKRWPFTPKAQQQDPVSAYRHLYQRLRERHGKYQIIAAPSFDLVRSMVPGYNGKTYPKFVHLNLAAKIAPYAHGYVIQAQGAESDPSWYRSVVLAVSKQVHKANPSAVILAGLSSNPSKRTVSVRTLNKDVRDTKHLVSGYAFSIHQHGKYCPLCGETDYAETSVKVIHRAELTSNGFLYWVLHSSTGLAVGVLFVFAVIVIFLYGIIVLS